MNIPMYSPQTIRLYEPLGTEFLSDSGVPFHVLGSLHIHSLEEMFPDSEWALFSWDIGYDVLEFAVEPKRRDYPRHADMFPRLDLGIVRIAFLYDTKRNKPEVSDGHG